MMDVLAILGGLRGAILPTSARKIQEVRFVTGTMCHYMPKHVHATHTSHLDTDHATTK
jgi:hypothetical protein